MRALGGHGFHAGQAIREPPQRSFRVAETLPREVELLAVVRRE